MILDKFPDFMKRESNLIPANQQNTPDIEGYYYTAADGSQMAFWSYKADRVSAEHTHDYDEYMICVQGEYLVTINGEEHMLHAGDELFIPKGSMQGGRVKAGTRSIHAFGGRRVNEYRTMPFDDTMKEAVHSFLSAQFECCGKSFEPQGRHSIYNDITGNFELFLCILENGDVVGTAALKRLNESDCELKALYLCSRLQGRKMGYSLMCRLIDEAKKRGFERMYLDSMSCYTRALKLYKGLGFREIQRYNDNEKADVFMVLDLV